MTTDPPRRHSRPDPAISVVVPTFNQVDRLPAAVESVLRQSWQNFELLVVDDGSTDSTPEWLASLDDPRVRTLRQDNRGVSAARNRGLETARGEVVTFLDSDGEAEIDWLASFAAAFGDPRVAVTCAGAKVCWAGEEGDGRYRILLPEDRGPVYAGRRVRYAPPGTLAARRALLDHLGGYAPQLRFAENTELAMRLFPHAVETGFETAAIDRPLVRYALDPTGWSGDARRHALMLAGAEYILQRHGSRLLAVDPGSYANYAAVAAVNAVRTGELTAARRHFAAAARARPWRLRGWLRWGLTLLPALARRFWSRHATAGDRGEAA